jgi:DNA-directed RNA polymerase subunit RPC12/RpoP
VLLENGLAEPQKVETKGRSKEVWFACVLSDKSELSSEKTPDEESFNAYNAFNAPETKDSSKCVNCGLKLELIEDNSVLFCPMGCGSRRVKQGQIK